jgi:hypothetical protein
MPLYDLTVTEKYKPGVPVVTLPLPGQPLVFVKAAKTRHKGIDLTPELARQLIIDGLEVAPIKAPAKSSHAPAESLEVKVADPDPIPAKPSGGAK